MKLSILALTVCSVLLPACRANVDQVVVPGETEWEVTAGRISGTPIKAFIDAAGEPVLNSEKSQFCRFTIDNKSISWMEARVRANGRKSNQPRFDTTPALFLATEKNSGRRYIETASSLSQTADGVWYKVEPYGDPVISDFIQSKVREAGCWGW